MLTLERQFAFFDESLSWLLVRIGAISKSHPLNRPHKFIATQLRRSILFSEISTNRIIICRCHLERLQCKSAPKCLTDISVAVCPAQQKFSIITRIGENRDSFMIFGGCTKKSDTSYIYFLNCVG